MPRYFLHIRDGARLIMDPDGIEARNLEEARNEAIESAREILAEKLRAGEILDGQEFDICDKAGNVLSTVPFSSTIRTSPRPI